jgi:hypothetical protein
MPATTVTGTLVNPAVDALDSATVAITLVDLNDQPVTGFDAADMLETIDTALATPDAQSGEWSIGLTPNSAITLFDGESASAYRVVESSAGASSLYWIVVTASADPVWVGTLRTAQVAPGEPAQLPGTWCSLTDVVTYTGNAQVTQSHLNIAQVLLEAHIHRIWRATDVQKRDIYWLSRATAFQALYVHAHPEILTMMDPQSISQDGLSISFRQGTQALPVIAPMARRILDAMFRASNTSIRMNSAFQKNRMVGAGVGSGGSQPWTPM